MRRIVLLATAVAVAGAIAATPAVGYPTPGPPTPPEVVSVKSWVDCERGFWWRVSGIYEHSYVTAPVRIGWSYYSTAGSKQVWETYGRFTIYDADYGLARPLPPNFKGYATATIGIVGYPEKTHTDVETALDCRGQNPTPLPPYTPLAAGLAPAALSVPAVAAKVAPAVKAKKAKHKKRKKHRKHA